MEVVNDLKSLVKNYNENRLSHAFLIETNDIEKCFNDIKKVIKVINCENKYQENCNFCNLCYQIDKNTLPSFITIEPEGSTIKKSQIIELKEKMYTKPVYSKYNCYVILNSDKLNSSSANTMLKFIEEPEENIIGFFITNHIENIIDTIRSRCQILYQKYDVVDEKIEEEKKNLIQEYIKNIELDNPHTLLYNKNVFLEKNYTREETIQIFIEMFKIYNAVYTNKTISEEYAFLNKMDKLSLAKKLNIINKAIQNLNRNGNINLILDTFVIEMR